MEQIISTQRRRTKGRSKQKRRADLYFIFALFFSLPTLIALKVLPNGWTYPVLGLMLGGIAAYYMITLYTLQGRKFRWKVFVKILYKLGIRKDNLKKALSLNIAISFAFIVVMFIGYKLHIPPKAEPQSLLFYFFYGLASAIAQEFFFRSVVYAELKHRKVPDEIFIILSAINFSYLHIFSNDSYTMGMTLAAGVVWGWTYTKYPNFWGIALSHIAVGITAIELGYVR